MSFAIKKAAVTVGVAGALAATAIIGGAGTASASTIGKGYVQVCAQGNYKVVASFPNRGGYSSTIINPGSCWYNYMGGSSSEPINIVGYFNTSSKTFNIGTKYFNGSTSGIGIGAEGTTSNGGAGAYLITW